MLKTQTENPACMYGCSDAHESFMNRQYGAKRCESTPNDIAEQIILSLNARRSRPVGRREGVKENQGREGNTQDVKKRPRKTEDGRDRERKKQHTSLQDWRDPRMSCCRYSPALGRKGLCENSTGRGMENTVRTGFITLTMPLVEERLLPNRTGRETGQEHDKAKGRHATRKEWKGKYTGMSPRRKERIEQIPFGLRVPIFQ